ncbi:hypothetical protein NQ314_016907 [Rhamnusium bicolor]|uniref:DDE Tnp4 domain-containing protein n=1 Tax=Rhamnusium bicolor TaxID=1586634 RepID=A0AAV8WVB8_9CUCU|nr:hypothetical protein NQ314_016907 [Rhamnusium bicolor]
MMSDEGDSDLLTDGEDDLEGLLPNEPRVKNSHYLEETVSEYSDAVFFEHYRISRGVVNDISRRYGNIPASHQVLIYLWYIGHQTASFRDVAVRFDISLSSVNRIICRVTLFLSNLSPQIIEWPTEDEKRTIEGHFRESGFPNIIRAIDGCHIKVNKPENDPDSYINRKGNNLEGKCGRYYLLADSGYPLRRNMLTPYKDRGNLTRRQQNYNIKLAKNRYKIEHCFGMLKQKFRQLYHVKLRNIRLIVHLIRAACVLHNISLDDFNVAEEIVANLEALVPAE